MDTYLLHLCDFVSDGSLRIAMYLHSPASLSSPDVENVLDIA